MATLKLFRGMAVNKTFHAEDGAGADLNLTGRTIFLSCKKMNDQSDADTNALFSITVTTHSDAVHGDSVIPFLATDTDIDPGNYKADIKIYGNGMDVNTNQFIIEIVRPVTERTS